MKSLRARAIRTMLSALIDSDLSPRELIELSRMLLSERELVDQLSFFLRQLGEHLDVPANRKGKEPLGPKTDRMREALMLIRARKLSKPGLVALLSHIAPETREWIAGPNMTTRAVLSTLEQRATDEVIHKLLDRLRSDDSGTDEYLKQLLKRT